LIQTLFPNNDAVFQDDNGPIHTAGSVQSRFEENQGEFQQLPWPAQSSDLTITEPFWSVLETRLRNRFPPPTSPKQLEDVLQGDDRKFRQKLLKTCTTPFQEDCGCIEGKRCPTPY
jgi:hypothetical protein